MRGYFYILKYSKLIFYIFIYVYVRFLVDMEFLILLYFLKLVEKSIRKNWKGFLRKMIKKEIGSFCRYKDVFCFINIFK